NIIRMKRAFHDVGNGMYYIVMDKMEGSVAELLHHNRGYLTEEHALAVLRCVAKALAYLHQEVFLAKDYVHRDIKSDNVLVGRNCEVKLADLGSAAGNTSIE
ncbi:mitogen-activated protein kinase, partial [Aphelenchoides avenae]